TRTSTVKVCVLPLSISSYWKNNLIPALRTDEALDARMSEVSVGFNISVESTRVKRGLLYPWYLCCVCICIYVFCSGSVFPYLGTPNSPCFIKNVIQAMEIKQTALVFTFIIINIIIIIHPSIFYTAYPFQGHGEPGAYPREHRAQGGVHPGQGANIIIIIIIIIVIIIIIIVVVIITLFLLRWILVHYL
ncbi:hypothetical protein AMELA_G00068940, partial [Ameiurus melas]